ncbi:MAG: hypothetical protein P0Y55_18225 [Candidatus Cohnella colombiensis]|uniref:DUF2178 domain-containing protein n=1 Tax=Candidatus Cohnella colombiensis TaxID=3121368 RepID=A0AA95JG13_9BACL|nr:MAG: hypothetical protein P0Y55_18225 [Cohnella sp.]
MSFQEKRNIVSLISTLLIFGSYCLYNLQKFPNGNTSLEDTISFWGSFILILLPVTIVAKIIISIAFSIIHKIATNEKEPSFSDELDKLIELKSHRNSYFMFGLGFVLAMGSLVIDKPINVMFLILLISGFTAEVTGYISQLMYYRRGV